jgi:chloramphenicol-sensitive protein RarD
MKSYKLGLIFGVSAYSIWGLFPLYWPLLEPSGSVEIVANRSVWTLLVCMIALAISQQLRVTISLMKNVMITLKLALTSILISINWLVYIWGVNHNHVVECALGYYINPLIIIAFGVLLLKEKMRKLQWVSVAIAAVGVIVLTIDYGRPPWIALTLALSWGSYGVIKKQLNIPALQGLTIETLLSLPIYGGYLIFLAQQGHSHFGQKTSLTLLLIGAGVVTAIPLLLFNGSGNRLPFTIIGLLQYITPTLQFIIGVSIRHEKMSTGSWIGFFIIWGALIALGMDLVKSSAPSDDRIAEVK